MKCSQCGTANEPKNKFCFECGGELVAETAEPDRPLVSHLYGKEVDVLFYAEPYTEKIGGIVNPSPEQKMRYRKDGLVQRVIVESPITGEDSHSTVLAFIRQSKEYLGEEFHEAHYQSHSLPDLKKEYLKLFERVLKMKEKRMEPPKAAGDPKSEKK